MGGADNGGPKRVFAVLLSRRHQREQGGLVEPVEGVHVGQRGFAGGDGAGLVEHDGVELVRGLQGFGGADEDAGRLFQSPP